jgi:hypothetical protein
MTLTLIAGLLGSGKSNLCRSMQVSGVILDDYDLDIFNSMQLPFVIGSLQKGLDCVMASWLIGIDTHRDELVGRVTSEVPGVGLDWIFFEPDLTACIKNITRRCRRAQRSPEWELGILMNIYPKYTIPTGHSPRPVWKPHLHVDQQKESTPLKRGQCECNSRRGDHFKS